MTPNEFLQVILALNTAGLFGGVIVGIKLVRHLSRVELQIDLMWDHFKVNVIGENTHE
jgi:hypothetical protein